MKEMLLTDTGKLVNSVTKVYIADDGTIFKNHNECNIYEKLGININEIKIPETFEFLNNIWSYPSIDGYNFELDYSCNSNNDLDITFKITKNGIFLDDIYYWNRCTELNESYDLLDKVSKKYTLEDIVNDNHDLKNNIFI